MELKSVLNIFLHPLIGTLLSVIHLTNVSLYSQRVFKFSFIAFLFCLATLDCFHMNRAWGTMLGLCMFHVYFHGPAVMLEKIYVTIIKKQICWDFTSLINQSTMFSNFSLMKFHWNCSSGIRVIKRWRNSIFISVAKSAPKA